MGPVHEILQLRLRRTIESSVEKQLKHFESWKGLFRVRSAL